MKNALKSKKFLIARTMQKLSSNSDQLYLTMNFASKTIFLLLVAVFILFFSVPVAAIEIGQFSIIAAVL